MEKEKNALILTSKTMDAVMSLKTNISALKESKKVIMQQKSIYAQEESTLLLLDVSLSMNDLDGDERPKIDAVKNIVAKIKNAKKIAFSSSVEVIGNGCDLGYPGGNTNLAYAFEYIRTKGIYRGKKIILVSDGEPDDPELAIEELKMLKQPIYIIYIGESGTEGEYFMKKIASITKGSSHIVQPMGQNFTNRLENSVKTLLIEKI
jgi:hypothetical protein